MHPVTVFIERFRAAVSVHIGPCCPALLELYSCKSAYCCIIGQIRNDTYVHTDNPKTVLPTPSAGWVKAYILLYHHKIVT